MATELFYIRYYISLLFRHPLRFVIPVIVVIGIGLLVVLQQPRSYVSVARIGMQTPQISSSLVESTVSSEGLRFMEQRVFSRDNLVALGNKLGLVPQRDRLSSGQVAELVRAQINVDVTTSNPNDPTSNSAVITIRFEAGTPELAAAGANEVIQMLILENRKMRTAEASQLRLFFEREVATKQQMSDALETELNAFVQENEALLPSRLAIYTSEMQDLQGELQAIQTANVTLAADSRILETQLALAETPTSSVENQLSELRSELETKRTLFSDTHPEIISLNSRIANLEQSLTAPTIPAEPTALSPSAPVTASNAESAMLNERVLSARKQQSDYETRRSEINDRLDWLRGTISEMPRVESELTALQRRRDAALADLNDMQGRLDTALVGERLVNAQQDSQITAIDQPEVPLYASGTGRTRAMMTVAAIALAIGAAVAVLWDFLDRTIKSKRNLLPILEGGTLVLIPEWTPGKAASGKGITTAFALFVALGLLSLITPGSGAGGTPPHISAVWQI